MLNIDAGEIALQFELTLGQAKTYSALVRLGNASAPEIVRETGIHRALVYDYMNQLVERGMAARAEVNNRLEYAAVSPSAVARGLREGWEKERRLEDGRRKKLEGLVSELERQFAASEKPNASILYGMEGVKALFREISSSLGPGEEDLVFIANSEGRAQFGPTILKYYREMGRNGARARVIFDGRPETVKIGLKTAKLPFVSVRFLPAEFSTLTTLHVFHDTACLLLFSKAEVFGLKIGNGKVADGFRKQFEALWELASPPARFRTARS
ncbi:MAG: helix-turn-helix domain-containing protein [Candidatus Micrarchaeota archaeon]